MLPVHEYANVLTSGYGFWDDKGFYPASQNLYNRCNALVGIRPSVPSSSASNLSDVDDWSGEAFEQEAHHQLGLGETRAT